MSRRGGDARIGPRRRGRLIAVLLVALLAALVWQLGPRDETEPSVVDPADTWPEGRWRRSLVPAGVDLDELQRARLVSLGYVAGSVESSGGETGVVVHEPERSWQGLNLYVSGHAAEARLMSMEGELLHRWEHDFRADFPLELVDASTGYFRRATVLEGGDLVALYQGSGLVRLDPESSPRWTRVGGFYNDLWVDPVEHRILVLEKRLTKLAELGQGEVLEDFVTEIDLVTGEVRGRVSLLRPLLESAWQEVVPRPPPQRDVLHNNTINVLGEVADSPFESGQLLLSMREVDTVGVFDLETGSWVWAQRGPWRRQHEPVYRPGGRILLFDNQGGAGRMARALLWDVADGRVEREVGGFVSLEAGAVAALPNGNWLVTVSESGYAVELDPRGDRVWEFRSPHRAGREGELVATLFEVVRLSPSLLAELR